MASARWFGVGQARFAQAADRLGSGLRITSAQDDAAGLKLASRIDGQINGWHQAQKNVQDGISLAQVVDGAFTVLTGIVGRIRELAVQSANGTYSDVERQAMQAEVDILRGEITNVIEGTTFNGVTPLRGDTFKPPPDVDPSALASALIGANFAYGTANTQSGIYDVRVLQAPGPAKALGFGSTQPLPAGAGTAVQLNVTGTLGSRTIDLAYGDDINAWVLAINAETANTGVQAATVVIGANSYMELQTTGSGGRVERISVSATTLDPAINPDDYLGITVGGRLTATGTDMEITINGVAAQVKSGPTQTVFQVNAPGDPADGLVVTIGTPLDPVYTTGPFPLLGNSAGTIEVEAFAEEIISLVLDIQSGPNSPDQQSLTIKPMIDGAMAMAGANTIGTIDLTTQAGALAAIDVADAAVTQIVDGRTQIAADMKALDEALTVTGINGENQTAAHAHIMDADVAAESVELMRGQLQSDLAATANTYIHADAARTLQLITDSRVGVLLQPSAPPQGGGAPAASAGGGGGGAGALAAASAPAAMDTGGASGASVMSGGSGYSPAAVLSGSFSPMATTPGFAAQAATPGYQAMPILGSGSLGGGQGLSSNEMLSMIAGGLA